NVVHWPDISERLPAEFCVVGERDAGFGCTDDHFLDLRLGMIGRGNPVSGINRTDAQESFVYANFGEGPLRPLPGKIESIFLQVSSCAQDCDSGAALKLADNS